MYDYAVIDNIPSTEYDFYLADMDRFEVPERDVDVISIPGRSGELTIDNECYKNIERKLIFYTRNIERLQEFEAFLSSLKGYVRIETTIESEHFYLARISGYEIGGIGNRTGAITVILNCKPQRYLISGENKIVLNKSRGLYNDTFYDARPLLRVYGVGSIKIGNVEIYILKNTSYIDIDTDLMEAYRDGANCNADISLMGYEFPILKSRSKTQITINGGISKVEIIPRWWTI